MERRADFLCERLVGFRVCEKQISHTGEQRRRRLGAGDNQSFRIGGELVYGQTLK